MFCHKMRAGVAAALAAGSMYGLYALLSKYSPSMASELMALLHQAPVNGMHFAKALLAVMGIAFVFVYLLKAFKGLMSCCGSECK